MKTEPWGTILAAGGVVLLSLAAAAGAAHRLRSARHGRLVAAIARTASVVPLAAAILLAVVLYGGPSLFGARLGAVALVLAASAIHLVLAFTLDWPGGLWPVDALLAGLLATMLLVTLPGAAAMDCVQHSLPFFAGWGLCLIGSGALLVAGGMAAAALAKRGRQPRVEGGEEQDLLSPVLLLALVALGGGLLVGTWWAWQTTGTLVAGDQRQVWMAVSWVVTGMALLAGELEDRADQWMAGLAVVAASIMAFGLLALPDLLQLWGG
ncbi:MAG: hypothetical protein JXA93_15965 [Anaerolineae bacterium]|nr:hypothetical protein [Anaerolineae bacterium]